MLTSLKRIEKRRQRAETIESLMIAGMILSTVILLATLSLLSTLQNIRAY